MAARKDAGKDTSSAKSSKSPAAKKTVKDLTVRASEADKVRGGLMSGPPSLK
jgi:hypothetical protein